MTDQPFVELDVNVSTEQGMLRAGTKMQLPKGADWLDRGMCHHYDPQEEAEQEAAEAAKEAAEKSDEGLSDEDLVAIAELRGKNLDELKEALPGVSSLDLLGALLADEERKGAIEMIEGRIDALIEEDAEQDQDSDEG